MGDQSGTDRATAKLTEGPIVQTLVGLAGPMVIGLFSVMAFNLTDTYFVSQLGTLELAAMSFTFPVVSVLFGVTMGLSTGTVSVVSRAIGRGEMDRVKRVSSDSLLLAFIVVLVLAGVGVLTIDPLFRAMGAAEDVLPLIREYMIIWYPGIVFLVVPMVANASIRALGDTRVPALIMTGAMTLNLVLDPLLIFGLLGFPRLELAGAAIATVIARACTLIVSLAILRFRENLLDFSPPRLTDVLASWKQVTYIAVPASATNIMPSFSLGFVTRLVSTYGASAVAAWGAGSRISYFVLIPALALSSGLVPFIGQNWGAERYDRVRTARRYGYRFAFLWGAAMVIVLNFAAEPVAALFSGEPDVIDSMVGYLWIIPLGFGFTGILLVAEETLNSIGKPIAATVQTAIHTFCLYAPLAFLGSAWSGLAGLFAGVVVADVLGGFVGMAMVRRICYFKEKRL